MKEHRIWVADMSCMHCVAAIRGALEKVAGVEAVEVTLETKSAKVMTGNDMDVAPLLAAVAAAGYTPEAQG